MTGDIHITHDNSTIASDAARAAAITVETAATAAATVVTTAAASAKTAAAVIEAAALNAADVVATAAATAKKAADTAHELGTVSNEMLQRLSGVSIDIGKMLAVHEQRLNQNDRTTLKIEESVEQRRTDLKHQTDELYTTIEKSRALILAELKDHASESKKQIGELTIETAKQIDKIKDRMSSFEKYLWIAVGAISIVSWMLSFMSSAHILPFQK